MRAKIAALYHKSSPASKEQSLNITFTRNKNVGGLLKRDVGGR